MSVEQELRKPSYMEFILDPKYEFCAPQFFDFCLGETDEEAAAAERWFTGALGHSSSPLVGNVKTVEELSQGCSLEKHIEIQKLLVRVTPEPSKIVKSHIFSNIVEDRATTTAVTATNCLNQDKEYIDAHLGENIATKEVATDTSQNGSKEKSCLPKEKFPQRFAELQGNRVPIISGRVVPSRWKQFEQHKQCTLRNTNSSDASIRFTGFKRCRTGHQQIAVNDETDAAMKRKVEGCQVTNASGQKSPIHSTISQQCDLNGEKRQPKRQKLEGGQFGHVMHSKTPRHILSLTVPHEFHFHTDKRAHIHAQCIADAQDPSSSMPYISVAEMVQRFQTNILADFKTQGKLATSRKRNLKLTYPKEPLLGTSLRMRHTCIKSTAEREEEMLAKLPKFRARPVNKRILQGATLLPPPRKTPQLPEFQEFNLKTMERALMHHNHYVNASIPMTVTISSSNNEQQGLSREEPDHESHPRIRKKEPEKELSILSKFKARPLDRRIFLSRGELGVFRVSKRQVTVPKEFQFATNQRAQQHSITAAEQQKQGFNQSRKYSENFMPYGSCSQQTSNGPSYCEKNRKPLIEIQQQLPLGQRIQQTKLKKNENDLSFQDVGRVDLNSQPFLRTDDFSQQIRSMSESMQHLAPAILVEPNAARTTFSAYYMR
ncbi:hypothetical protein KP509_33G028200 [Ceratopteris richardii]|uniref:TPX2 central domain-containing protein n=1 Tax=Ceratopteris richardii TaxID=49495 RepID=A0A8T2QNB5_CERRI|nr:hypothetical protein KP509_33G028200 [Ceratopteris richardii]KAH7285439.1 hypothetical protein KP509_33G028200 [Ceratopteris richardii]